MYSRSVIHDVDGDHCSLVRLRFRSILVLSPYPHARRLLLTAATIFQYRHYSSDHLKTPHTGPKAVPLMGSNGRSGRRTASLPALPLS